jgi:hypothetical protein
MGSTSVDSKKAKTVPGTESALMLPQLLSGLAFALIEFENRLPGFGVW